MSVSVACLSFVASIFCVMFGEVVVCFFFQFAFVRLLNVN